MAGYEMGVNPCPSRVLSEPAFELQMMEHLRNLTVTREAGQWLVENLRASLADDAVKVKSTRTSLQQALTAAEQDWYELVTMKRRQQVDEATFERQRIEVLDRKAHLELKLAEPEQTPAQLVDRAEEILNFAGRSLAAFQNAKDDPIGRREIVQAVTCSGHRREMRLRSQSPVLVPGFYAFISPLLERRESTAYLVAQQSALPPPVIAPPASFCP
jgi:hypothetical protein